MVGTCNTVDDALKDAESNCNSLIGNRITITRSCPTPPCQLGLCGAGFLTECDCQKTKTNGDYIDFKYFV